MYGFYTFLHMVGFIVWLGLLLAMVVILSMLKKKLDTEIGQNLVHKVIRAFSILIHPAALIVLVSGIYRIVQMNFGDAGKPFWLNYMEMGGGVIVLLGIVLTAILGRRVTKPLSTASTTAEIAVVDKRLSTFVSTNVLFIVLILSVVFVVSFRL